MCRFAKSTTSEVCCNLCKLPYQREEPRVPCLLPNCFHSFCRHCLSERTVDGEGHFECPICKTKCQDSAAQLSVNQALMNEIESQLLAKGELRLACKGCGGGATKHCEACKMLLCEGCAKDHSQFKPLASHQLTLVAKMKHLPKERGTCLKHRGKALRLVCSTCSVMICDDCPIKDHKDHDYDVLDQVAGVQRSKLKEQASVLEEATAPLRQGIEHIKRQKGLLTESRNAAKERVRELHDAVVEAMRARTEELEGEIDRVCEKKQKILEEQWRAVGLVVAGRESVVSHVRTTTDKGDDQQVAEAYGQAMQCLKLQRETSVEIEPSTSSTVHLAWRAEETMEWLLERVARHGMLRRGDFAIHKCVAEGAGLCDAAPEEPRRFTVTTRDVNGEKCASGGELVEVRVLNDAGDGVSVDAFSVTDRHDGAYDVEYIAKGEGTLRMEVSINGKPIPDNPFNVIVKKPGVKLVMEAAFDGNGAIAYIGTGGGARVFTNPHNTGDVLASMSSVYNGDPRRFVQGNDHDGNYNYTDNRPGSWMAVDLKRFQLAPNAYCLRSDAYNGRHKLRNWQLEGSDDGATWTTLKVHENDAALGAEGFSTASWGMAGFEGRFFRHFRILQTGPNSSGSIHLMCAGIELYGVLREGGEGA